MNSRRFVAGGLILCLGGALYQGVSALVSHRLTAPEKPFPIDTAYSTLFLATSPNTVTSQKSNAISKPPTAINLSNTFLEGTDWSGQFRLGPDGHLIIDAEFADHINYVLQLSDTFTMADIRETLFRKASEELPADALAEAKLWIDRYLNYIEAEADSLQQLRADTNQPSDMQIDNALTERRLRRREFLGDEAATAIFSDEEAYEDYQLQLVKISKDKSLDATSRNALIEQAQASLPVQLREQEAATQSVVSYQNKLAELKQRGASTEELQNLRSQLFTPDAAERLAQVDAEQNQWESARKRYIEQRNALRADQSLTDDDRTQQINKFMQTDLSLSPGEQQRMRALDYIEQHKQLAQQH